MYYGFDRGRGAGRGRGGMGFGFRGSSPPWPYIGRGRGGLPRGGYYYGGAAVPAAPFYQPQVYNTGVPFTPGYTPDSSQMTREEELNYMKGQAEAIKGELEEIEAKMRDLKTKKE